MQRVLERGWHAAVEMQVRRLSRGGARHPAELLGDVQHMRINRKLGSLQIEHQNARHGLWSDALMLQQFRLDEVSRLLPKPAVTRLSPYAVVSVFGR